MSIETILYQSMAGRLSESTDRAAGSALNWPVPPVEWNHAIERSGGRGLDIVRETSHQRCQRLDIVADPTSEHSPSQANSHNFDGIGHFRTAPSADNVSNATILCAWATSDRIQLFHPSTEGRVPATKGARKLDGPNRLTPIDKGEQREKRHFERNSGFADHPGVGDRAAHDADDLDQRSVKLSGMRVSCTLLPADTPTSPVKPQVLKRGPDA